MADKFNKYVDGYSIGSNDLTMLIMGTEAPSEYPDFTEFLVKSGIDYVSVNPDMVKETKFNVAHFEQRILLDKATGLGMQDTEDYGW